ncbi:hypothetical protein IscW_ISCW016269 [Ixodes scapularis]|uniref:Uncharacterized protein n=1 Tax=Ixodes scapularis TaxID=6945 RepID=B7P110_IXOSC|nr:hypothetical protein IscW_ISCW016269 [Ixodes scapularis]|eukprot:XP_002399811.1 hypothetical protein IscW_ISCW016269 [Ixodes scapularis]
MAAGKLRPECRPVHLVHAVDDFRRSFGGGRSDSGRLLTVAGTRRQPGGRRHGGALFGCAGSGNIRHQTDRASPAGRLPIPR